MQNHNDLTFEELQTIYTKVPRLGAEIVIITEQGTLLTLRAIKPSQGLWHLPGGTVYADETVPEAVRRIAKAELGIEVTVGELLGYVDYPPDQERGGFGHAVSLYFACTPKSLDIVLDFQATEYGFFKELPANTVKQHREFLERLK